MFATCTVTEEIAYHSSSMAACRTGADELQQWVIARKLIGRDVTG